MSETNTTPFSSKCEILAELWIAYRTEEAFKELIEYGDLAFPLSFAIAENIVDSTPLAQEYIQEIWDLFIGQLEIDETDTQFSTLDDVLNLADFGSMDR